MIGDFDYGANHSQASKQLSGEESAPSALVESVQRTTVHLTHNTPSENDTKSRI